VRLGARERVLLALHRLAQQTPRPAASPDVIVTRFRARPRYRYERKSVSWSSMVMIAKFLTVDISK
jgi:hypothetical protein